MSAIICPACTGQLTNRGKIPDGILLECKECGSKKIFIEDYESKKDDSGYGIAYRKNLNGTKIINLLELFNKNFSTSVTKLKLLDIGFGSGSFLVALDKNNIEAAGLECDINAVNLLDQKGIAAYFGELGGELKIDVKFDLITLWDVLEHINDIEKALSQLASLINKNGRLFILTPNADSIFDLLAEAERNLTILRSQRIMNICLNKYHLHRFSEKGLAILLDRFGFAVDHMETIQNFSLKPDEYTDGFAPGIIKWTASSSLNKALSSYAMKFIKMLNIRNKIFVTAVRR